MYNSYTEYNSQTTGVGAYSKARISLQEKYDVMVQCKYAPLTTWIYSLFCIKTICMVEDQWIAFGKHVIMTDRLVVK